MAIGLPRQTVVTKLQFRKQFRKGARSTVVSRSVEKEVIPGMIIRWQVLW